MRRDQEGRYYYSLTGDVQAAAAPRWLLAVNGVLYGLKVEESALLFVAKPIEMKVSRQPELRSERRR